MHDGPPASTATPASTQTRSATSSDSATRSITKDRSCAVAVEKLVMTYGDRTAVSGISWHAQPGEILALLGPNGAGKTSTIEALEGYRTPTSGSVRVLGLDPQKNARALAPRIGVMLQRNGVYLTMGPRDVLRLFATYYEDRARNPDELLARVGLEHVATTPWRRLSGGEQQRLALAMAIVGRPEVVFLDEPTAMIDPTARSTVRELINELRSEGACVILTTHDLDDAERLADTIVILDSGRIVAQGTPAQLTTADANDGVAFSSRPGISTTELAALSEQVGAGSREVVETSPGNYLASVAPSPANVAAITSWLANNGHEIGTVRAGRRSLEDVFVKLTATATEQADLLQRESVGRRKTMRRTRQRSRQ